MHLQINLHDNEPLYMQIYNYIKSKITLGDLKPDEKLPSSRAFAEGLSVSRNTIDLAYGQLLSEGYIYSKLKSGYYVSPLTDLPNMSLPKIPTTNMITIDKKEPNIDFSPYAIDTSKFPYHTWKKLYKDSMNESNQELFLLGNPQGDMSLRSSIHNYLTNFRFVHCTTDNILVGAGADYLLQLLSQILRIYYKYTPPKIGMENPTYIRAYKIFRGFSFPIQPLTMDHNGISINSLNESNCNLVYITPSHQYPTGTIMSIARRQQLLHWANNGTKRFIIEDDHDSEFRYKGKPIPSLQGIDSSNRVIYLGTFSRALTPALRVAYMVLPEELYQVYKANFNYYSQTVSRIDQRILSEFINGGYFERHLNKMRKLYKMKHDLLIQCLRAFGNQVTISGENAGLHLVITFHINLSEEKLIELGKDNGIQLYGISNHYINATHMEHEVISAPTILLGYGDLSMEEIEQGISKLYQILKDIN